MTRLRAVSALASVTILSLALPTLTFADSQIRMVRLSQVDGTVQIDRNSGNGFEKAIPNMPITQGVRLQTGSYGRAEVEMEDGTTIRLAPDTAMSFPELVLHDSGVRASTAQLTLGTAYFDVRHKKKEEIRVAFAHQSIDVDHEVRFRVSVDLATAKVSVFKGELKIPNSVETATLKKEQTATFDLVDEKQVATAKGIETLPTDNWDAERSEFQKQYSGSVYGNTRYGAAPDLAYYGQYSYIPGTGYFWQPFGAPVGWNPYMNGAWVWDAEYWLLLRFHGPMGMDPVSLRGVDIRERLRLGLDPIGYAYVAADSQNRAATCRIPGAGSSRCSQNSSRDFSRSADNRREPYTRPDWQARSVI